MRRLPASIHFSVFAFALAAALCCARGAAAESLHERIDREIAAKLSGPPAALASDAEFVRRIYLDLTGSAPSLEACRQFLNDPSPDKRERLIDRLLDSPEHFRRMQIVFDLMLMERRPDQNVSAAEWQEFLYQSFAKNTPYNELAREILAADGADPALRPAARFFLDRGADPNLLTRDVGRLFLGRDVQCSQCHDHPLISFYKQTDYYGVYSFLSRTVLFTDKQKKSYLGEKADGDVAFTSVFTKETTEKRRPQLPEGPAVDDPAVPAGQEYLVAPADGVRPVPRYSRRAQLAPQATSGANGPFNRNIANRLWAMMFGRGIVHPVDLHHPDNPPSHPELLDLLAQEFVAMRFDMRAFLREIALSQTYQRSSEIPSGMSAADAAPERFAVAGVRPLSSEQLGWSVLQATGITEAYRGVAAANLVADKKMADILSVEPLGERLKGELVERTVYGQLQGSVAQFALLYGCQPGTSQDDFQATVHQALYFANGGTIKSWVAPGGNAVARLTAIADPGLLADDLYLGVLSRLPAADERAETVQCLQGREADRGVAIGELVWALMASVEFRFNH